MANLLHWHDVMGTWSWPGDQSSSRHSASCGLCRNGGQGGGGPMMMTLTEHERSEFSRCAKAAYAHGDNAIGHVLSAAAAIGTLPLAQYDRASRAYRTWLMWGFYPVEEATCPRCQELARNVMCTCFDW
mgnify:CR=1 FL=1